MCCFPLLVLKAISLTTGHISPCSFCSGLTQNLKGIYLPGVFLHLLTFLLPCGLPGLGASSPRARGGGLAGGLHRGPGGEPARLGHHAGRGTWRGRAWRAGARGSGKERLGDPRFLFHLVKTMVYFPLLVLRGCKWRCCITEVDSISHSPVRKGQSLERTYRPCGSGHFWGRAPLGSPARCPFSPNFLVGRVPLPK